MSKDWSKYEYPHVIGLSELWASLAADLEGYAQNHSPIHPVTFTQTRSKFSRRSSYYISSIMSMIAKKMMTKLHLEGTVNGYSFEIEGKGEGEPYEGTQFSKLVVTKGAPLPFAFDILSPQHLYGSKPFVKHPEEIPDYYKQSFPEGYSWERIMTFEDGAVCTVSNHSSIEGNCFVYDVKFLGVNFPPNGPVMQKKTLGWEPSTERLHVRDGMLIATNPMALKLQGGGHYLCDFKTIYKAKKAVKLPGYHFVDHHLEITKHDKDHTNVEQREISIARNSSL